MRVTIRFAVVAGLTMTVAGCASQSPVHVQNPAPAPPAATTANLVRIEIPERPLQCVPYARAHSGLTIHGDAWTWWKQAEGHYIRGQVPIPGAVIVFSRRGGPPGGHVAIVRSIDSRRQIRVDHANWLDHGRIYLNDPVIDVSAHNDWSRVRVWNAETRAWGGRIYPISGFIGPVEPRVASAAPNG